MPDLLRKPSSGVRCTSCDTRLVLVLRNAVTLKGRPPIELFSLPGSKAVHIVCGQCGTLVPLDEDMLILH